MLNSISLEDIIEDIGCLFSLGL